MPSVTILHRMCFIYMMLLGKFMNARALNLSLADVNFFEKWADLDANEGHQLNSSCTWSCKDQFPQTKQHLLPSQSCLHSVI